MKYHEQLLKLIPAEFVAIYLAISHLIDKGAETNLDTAQPILITTVITIVVLIVLVSKLEKKAWLETIIIAVSFVIWTYSLGDAYASGPWIKFDLHYQDVGSVALVLWTAAVPILMQYKFVTSR